MSRRLVKGYENLACHPEPKAKGLMRQGNQILRCAQNDSKVAGVFPDEGAWHRRVYDDGQYRPY